ncbi:tellurite resistance TerB family protein [Thalassotalea fusca]
MLHKIRQFFDSITQEETSQGAALDIEVACAVLLFEVINADDELSPEEQEKLSTIIQGHFSLQHDEVSEIIEQAKKLSEDANDFHQFTSQVNRHYSAEEKTKIVALLWQLALADGHVSAIEEHTIRKIADLLYLRHGEYIQAKLSIESP